MTKYDVQVGGRKVGAIGEMYLEKRHYVITMSGPHTRFDINAAAIKRAYEDGDIEHIRVEDVAQIS
jgi:hypothetical protein